MKTLYLVRHAKAVSGDVGVEDFKRALLERGIDDAVAISKRLYKKEIFPDVFLSSPADRALETAHIFAQKFGYPVQQILLNEGLYEEEEKTLKEVIRGLDDSCTTVMIFGHEPALSQFAGFLLQDSEIELQTSGVIGISLDIVRWQDITKGTGTLVFFDFPIRATPKVYKKARKVIAKEITSTMEDMLESIDGEVSKQLQKVFRKTSKKLAREMTKVLRASKVEELVRGESQKRIDYLKQFGVTKRSRVTDTQETVLPDHDREIGPVNNKPQSQEPLKKDPDISLSESKPGRRRQTKKPKTQPKTTASESTVPDHERETQIPAGKPPRRKRTKKQAVPKKVEESPNTAPDHDREEHSD